MSDSEHSTVTYTSVSIPVEDDSDIGSPGVNGPPIMPEDPYAYIMAAYEVHLRLIHTGLEVPPSPDYIPGPEEPQSPPPLDFVPEPMYPEYMPQEDEILPAEEQPLPAAASPTADSPGYVPESDPEEEPEEDDEDPEEDPADYPADRDDDDVDDGMRLRRGRWATTSLRRTHVLTYTVMTPKIYIRDWSHSISLPPREEVERLLALTTPHITTSPLHLHYHRIHHHHQLAHTHIEIRECLPLRMRGGNLRNLSYGDVPLDVRVLGVRLWALGYMGMILVGAIDGVLHRPPLEEVISKGLPILLPLLRRSLTAWIGCSSSFSSNDRDEESADHIDNGRASEAAWTEKTVRHSLMHQGRLVAVPRFATQYRSFVQHVMQPGMADDSNTSGRVQKPVSGLLTRECTYPDFLKCQPLNFKGTEGVEMLLHGGTPMLRPLLLEVAHAMPWTDNEKDNEDKYCPRGEIKKLEFECGNLSKGLTTIRKSDDTRATSESATKQDDKNTGRAYAAEMVTGDPTAA
ncbi:hypothetical protein Tco_0185874 [Tanacetum coccineum]